MKFELITAERINNRDILLIGREDKSKQKGTFIVKGFFPYFYVPGSGQDNKIGLDGTKVTKVLCSSPEEVTQTRSKWDKTYEADIIYTNRFKIDFDIKSGFIISDDIDIDWDHAQELQIGDVQGC